MPPLVESLIRLHNFCIDMREDSNDDVMSRNRTNISYNAGHSMINLVGADASVVEFDNIGCPTSLIGHGHHFNDAPRNRRVVTERVPMDAMIERVRDLGLVRPTSMKK